MKIIIKYTLSILAVWNNLQKINTKYFTQDTPFNALKFCCTVIFILMIGNVNKQFFFINKNATYLIVSQLHCNQSPMAMETVMQSV